MDRSGRWQTLDHGRQDIPQLFIQSTFTPDGYSVHLTDLSRVWVETLQNDEVVKRAGDLDSSIDPSEDAEQFSILLNKLQSAAQQQDGTDLELCTGRAGDDIHLLLSAPLPKPLPRLKWRLYLKRNDQDLVQVELVSPLLARAHDLESRITQLLDEIRAKDRVISRFSDRLESSGIPLTEVFPNVANLTALKKRPQREQLAQHVRGLARFDEDEWTAKSANRSTSLTAEVTDSVFREVLSSQSRDSGQDTAAEWWKAKSSNHPKISGIRYERHGEMLDPSESIEGEFQQQVTPEIPRIRNAMQTKPHLAAGLSPSTAEARQASTQDDDGSTEDEDLDAPPTRPSSLKKPRAVAEKPNVRTEAHAPAPPIIHSPAATDESSTLSQQSTTRSPRKLGTIGGQVRHATPADHDTSPEATPTPEAPRPQAKSKLGILGGRSKSDIDEAQVAPEQQSSPPPSQARIKKLGIIGGSRATATESARTSTTSRVTENGSPEPSPPEEHKSPPPPQESLEELANRKRDELKRQLREKTKAPAKKKRKF